MIEADIERRNRIGPVPVPGLSWLGEKVAFYWSGADELSNSSRLSMRLGSVCPHFGTARCIECDLWLDRAREVCDYDCDRCPDEEMCPCSRWSWERRDEEAIQRISEE